MKNKILLEEIQELIVNEGLGSYIDDIARAGKNILKGTKNYADDFINRHFVSTVKPTEMLNQIVSRGFPKEGDQKYLTDIIVDMYERNPKIRSYLEKKWGFQYLVFPRRWNDIVETSPANVPINIIEDIRNKFPKTYNQAVKYLSTVDDELYPKSKIPGFVKDTLKKREKTQKNVEHAAKIGTGLGAGLGLGDLIARLLGLSGKKNEE